MNNLNDGQLAEQTRLIKEGTGQEIVEFVLDNQGRVIDVSGLQLRLLEVGFDNHLWAFANNALGADIEALQSCILSLTDDRKAIVGSCRYIYRFCMLPGASIDACEAKILQEGTANDCFNFARYIPSANVPALYDRAIKLGFDRGSDTWMEDEDAFMTLRDYYEVNEAALRRK
jgi:hypothetical protein